MTKFDIERHEVKSVSGGDITSTVDLMREAYNDTDANASHTTIANVTLTYPLRLTAGPLPTEPRLDVSRPLVQATVMSPSGSPLPLALISDHQVYSPERASSTSTETILSCIVRDSLSRRYLREHTKPANRVKTVSRGHSAKVCDKENDDGETFKLDEDDLVYRLERVHRKILKNEAAKR